jgi:CDP-glucose 4,6-dehydratase
MHFLVTGHTGFKGAWLSLVLKQRGYTVSGLALEPAQGGLFTIGNVSSLIEFDERCDIRDPKETLKTIKNINPDVIIHMAAQSLVLEGYRDPVGTHDTNVLGTKNILMSSEALSNLKAQIIVTTDKVYKNVNKNIGYIEEDVLGGQDPYSSSKAEADLFTQDWMKRHKEIPTAIVRAGNVIGGGDVCHDRLLPDLINAYQSNLVPKLRFPNAVRPWQHVLDCLNGYLKLVDALLENKGAGAWNFGPPESDMRSVSEVTEFVGKIYGVENVWEQDKGEHPHEAGLLLLNSQKSRSQLSWKEKLNFETSLTLTVKWHQDVGKGRNPLDATLENISQFESTK